MMIAETRIGAYLKGMTQMRSGFPIPDGFKYRCQEDFVLKNGKVFASASFTPDEQADVEAVLAYDRRNYRIKECYFNSQMFLTAAKYAAPFVRLTTDFQYAEGFAITDELPFPVLHGWVSVNGKVLDLTMRVRPARRGRGRLKDRVFGEFAGREYVGVIIPYEAVRRRIIETKTAGSMIDDWERGFPLLRK